MKNISVTSLLNEKVRRELIAENSLRPMAEKNDIIWQQMTLDHFRSLIQNQALYFKAYSEYNDYDEMRIREFAGIHVESIPDLNNTSKEELKHKLEVFYDKIERDMFISCWYNSRYLSDIVFKIFAKGDNGVAIGTTVGDLMSCLGEACRTKSHICNIISGNVQYVPHNLLHSSSLFEPAQVYAPIFLKGIQFHLEHEFRVCVQQTNPQQLVSNKSYMNLGISPSDLIQYIALMENNMVKHIQDEQLIKIFEELFKVKMIPVEEKDVRGNGFRVFLVEKIGR